MVFKRFKEIFHLTSNQRKATEVINERFIHQSNKLHDKGDSTLSKDVAFLCHREEFKLLQTAESSLLTGYRGLKINCILSPRIPSTFHPNTLFGNMS